MSVVIIGIAGGSGSGKTTIAKKLNEVFSENSCVIYHDNYYRKRDDLSFEERKRINYDSPQAFETELLIGDLKKLRNNESVNSPLYDFNVHNRSTETIIIDPVEIIIVEGILVLENKELCDMLDLKVYVDTQADERILRRIERDVIERGRTLQSIIEQYRSSVRPMHNMYIEPCKKIADITVVGEGDISVAVNLIRTKIEELI